MAVTIDRQQLKSPLQTYETGKSLPLAQKKILAAAGKNVSRLVFKKVRWLWLDPVFTNGRTDITAEVRKGCEWAGVWVLVDRTTAGGSIEGRG